MKCEIQLEKFKKAITLTERVASRHSTLPVLACILIDIKKSVATLKSTNLDVGVEVEIPVKSDTDATFAVPAHTISAFLAQTNSKDQTIRLETSGGNLNVTMAKSKVVIKTLPPEDFPAIPAITDGNTTDLPSEILTKGFKSVWYSAAISNVKPELSSIFVYRNAEDVVFAATDSFRLAEKRVALPKGSNLEDMLIPHKNCVEIVKTLDIMGTKVTMKSNKNLVSFEADGVRIVSRIIDGVFPDYKQIIPKNFTTEVVMLKQDLINALKVSTVFTDSFNQIHMKIDPKKKIFEVDTKNNDVGENLSELDAAITGEPVEINFNCKYISDSFQSIDADSISMQFNGKNKPLVIKPISGDQTFLYLVMPMNR